MLSLSSSGSDPFPGPLLPSSSLRLRALIEPPSLPVHSSSLLRERGEGGRVCPASARINSKHGSCSGVASAMDKARPNKGSKATAPEFKLLPSTGGKPTLPKPGIALAKPSSGYCAGRSIALKPIIPSPPSRGPARRVPRLEDDPSGLDRRARQLEDAARLEFDDAEEEAEMEQRIFFPSSRAPAKGIGGSRASSSTRAGPSGGASCGKSKASPGESCNSSGTVSSDGMTKEETSSSKSKAASGSLALRPDQVMESSRAGGVKHLLQLREGRKGEKAPPTTGSGVEKQPPTRKRKPGLEVPLCVMDEEDYVTDEI